MGFGSSCTFNILICNYLRIKNEHTSYCAICKLSCHLAKRYMDVKAKEHGA